MTSSHREHGEASDLPQQVRLFPLGQAILFPRAIMPLNIFEPRYLQMVSDAMNGDRIIAMIQPRIPEGPLFGVGTTGRIIDFLETHDHRFLIKLKGVQRFRLVEELPTRKPWREGRVDYGGFLDDSGQLSALSATERAHLEETLKTYLASRNLGANWDSIHVADDENLVATLSTSCPFAVAERQMLLEAKTLSERTHLLTTLMQLSGEQNSKWLQ